MTPSGQANHVAPLRLFIIPRIRSVTDSVRLAFPAAPDSSATVCWALTDPSVTPPAITARANNHAELLWIFLATATYEQRFRVPQQGSINPGPRYGVKARELTP